MKSLFLVRVGEMALKGENKYVFENQLKKNLRKALKPLDVEIRGRNDRFFISCNQTDEPLVKAVLSRTFGVVSYSLAIKTEKNLAAIKEAASLLAEESVKTHPSLKTFKVNSKRSDKSFPLNSYQLACELGDLILKQHPHLKVDVKQPDWSLNLEIRERAYLFGGREKGPGGLPVGSAGRAILLLSGGIDSPVAGYLMAKRGLKPDAIYFHTYPYTSDEAKEKVLTLGKILAAYLGGLNVFVIPFTKVQLQIKQKALPEEVTLLTRYCMTRIAQMLLIERQAGSLITGESLSQVASQTPESIRFTSQGLDYPVFRPLIGMDKEEIINIAKRIGTFETSILPYDDCCSLFAVPHPLVKPEITRMITAQEKLAVDELLADAFAGRERYFMENQITKEGGD